MTEPGRRARRILRRDDDDEAAAAAMEEETATAPSDPKKGNNGSLLGENRNNDVEGRCCSDLLVIDPSALGDKVPSKLTRETARVVGQMARVNHQEDWARSYRFPAVTTWSGGASKDTKETLTRRASHGKTNTTTSGAGFVKTIIASGCPSKTNAIFGMSANVVVDDDTQQLTTRRRNGASLLPDRKKQQPRQHNESDDSIKKRYGLVGLALSQHLASSSAANASCCGDSCSGTTTLSMVEVADEDSAYDLLSSVASASGAPDAVLQRVRIQLKGTASSENGDSDSGSSSGSGGGSCCALLPSEVPVESLDDLERTVRVAFRTTPERRRRGHILAALRTRRDQSQVVTAAGSNSNSNNSSSSSSSNSNSNNHHVDNLVVTQFLDLANMIREGKKGSEGYSPARRNSFIANSCTALGAVLREKLLQEEGDHQDGDQQKDTFHRNDNKKMMHCYEKSILTRLLKGTLDNRISHRCTVLTFVSPFADDYAQTMETLRYASTYLYSCPNVKPSSPFAAVTSSTRSGEKSHESPQSSLQGYCGKEHQQLEKVSVEGSAKDKVDETITDGEQPPQDSDPSGNLNSKNEASGEEAHGTGRTEDDKAKHEVILINGENKNWNPSVEETCDFPDNAISKEQQQQQMAVDEFRTPSSSRALLKQQTPLEVDEGTNEVEKRLMGASGTGSSPSPAGSIQSGYEEQQHHPTTPPSVASVVAVVVSPETDCSTRSIKCCNPRDDEEENHVLLVRDGGGRDMVAKGDHQEKEGIVQPTETRSVPVVSPDRERGNLEGEEKDSGNNNVSDEKKLAENWASEVKHNSGASLPAMNQVVSAALKAGAPASNYDDARMIDSRQSGSSNVHSVPADSNRAESLVNGKIQGYGLESNVGMETLYSKVESGSSDTEPLSQELVAQLVKARDTAENKAEQAGRDLYRQSLQYRHELARKDDEIHELQKSMTAAQTERCELFKIAEEAIAAQVYLEDKTKEMGSELSKYQSSPTLTPEKLDKLEEACGALLVEVDKARKEARRYKMDLETQTVAMTEAEASLQCLEAEKSHLLDQQAKYRSSIEHLETALHQNPDAEAIAKLMLDKDAAEATWQRRERELLQELNQQREVVNRLRGELKDLKAVLSQMQEEQLQSGEVHKKEIGRLESLVSHLQEEVDVSQSSRHEAESLIASELSEKEKLSHELERTRSDLECRISDIQKLSEGMRDLLDSKARDESEIASLKKGFEFYQEETSMKVKQVVKRQSEAASLLEQTLDEKLMIERELAYTKRELDSTVEELRRERARWRDGSQQHRFNRMRDLEIDGLHELQSLASDPIRRLHDDSFRYCGRAVSRDNWDVPRDIDLGAEHVTASDARTAKSSMEQKDAEIRHLKARILAHERNSDFVQKSR